MWAAIDATGLRVEALLEHQGTLEVAEEFPSYMRQIIKASEVKIKLLTEVELDYRYYLCFQFWRCCLLRF